MFRQSALRRVASDECGMETIQSVMILAVSAMVLIAMHSFWSPSSGESGGILARLESKLDLLFNGGADDSSVTGGGTGSGGTGSGGTGSGGTGSGGTGSGGTGSGGTGSGGTGSGGTGSGGTGSGGTGSGGTDGADDDDGDGRDDGRLDPFPEDFTGAVAKAIGKRTEERILAEVAEGVAAAGKNVSVLDKAHQAAQQLYEAALQDPTVSDVDRLALRNRQSAAKIALENGRKTAQEAANHLAFATTQVQRFSRAVGTLGAVDGLIQADKRRQQLVAEGKYQQAYRESTGAALRYVASVATTFTDKLPGVTGTILSEAIASGADVAGQKLADDTFPSMVNLSHWLYERSWWPRNRRPRFPKGYDPART